MAPEPIATAYFINPSLQSVCLYVYPLLVARQRLGKNFTAATNTQAAIKELLDMSFSMRSGHGHFLPHSIQFITYYHRNIRRYTARVVAVTAHDIWTCEHKPFMTNSTE
jgi:hypothetical protein